MKASTDGKTIRYNPEIPHPGFVKAMDNIKNMEGYKYEQEKD